MQTKKWARLAAATLAFSLIAAACGDSSDSGSEVVTGATSGSTEAPATTAAAPATTAAAPTTEAMAGHPLEGAELTIWGWASSEAEDTQLTSVVAGINEATGANVAFEPQPEYDTALQAALVAGQPPDVFYVDSGKLPDLVASGALAPIPDGAISDPDDIYASLRDVFTIDDQLYCPPKDFSTLALIIDPEAFAAAGISAPTTWEELAAAAEALTTDDQIGLSFGSEYARAGAFLFQAGSDILSADGTSVIIDSDEARTALQYLADLHANGYAAAPGAIDTGWGGEAFASGAAAMTIEGNWIVGFLDDNFPDKAYEIVELPVGPAGPGTFAFTVCYGVSSAAADADLSWALAEELTNETGAAAWTDGFKVMPARESLADAWLADNPDLGAFVAGAAYASKFQFPSGVGEIQGVFNEQFQKLITGDVTVDELIAAVVSAGEDLGLS